MMQPWWHLLGFQKCLVWRHPKADQINGLALQKDAIAYDEPLYKIWTLGYLWAGSVYFGTDFKMYLQNSPRLKHF